MLLRSVNALIFMVCGVIGLAFSQSLDLVRQKNFFSHRGGPLTILDVTEFGGEIFIATNNDGLLRLSPDLDYTSNDSILPIAAHFVNTRNGTLYGSSYTQGLFLYQNGELIIHGPKGGFVSKVEIYSNIFYAIPGGIKLADWPEWEGWSEAVKGPWEKEIRNVIAHNNLVLLTADNTLYLSGDGFDFIALPNPVTTPEPRIINISKSDSLVFAYSDSSFFSSPDAANWQDHTYPPDWLKIAGNYGQAGYYRGNLYMPTITGSIMQKPLSGDSWSEAAKPFDLDPDPNRLDLARWLMKVVNGNLYAASKSGTLKQYSLGGSTPVIKSNRRIPNITPALFYDAVGRPFELDSRYLKLLLPQSPSFPSPATR